MRLTYLTGAIGMALLSLSLAASPAQADIDLDVLLDFDVIISDTGERYDGWEEHDSRVYARVLHRGREYDHYFSDIVSAYFVLHQRYGNPVRVLDLGVPEYAGGGHARHGHDGHGLLDASQAWYFWDNTRRERGGMPMVYAFSNARDAEAMSYSNDGWVLSFTDLTRTMRAWEDKNTQRCYWRGRDNWNSDRWNDAWNRRWDGWGMDKDRGWISLRIGLGGDNRGRGDGRDNNWRGGDHRDDGRQWRDDGRGDRDRRERDRQDRDRQERERRDRDNQHRDRNRDGGRDDNNGRDRGRDGDRDRERDGEADRQRERERKEQDRQQQEQRQQEQREKQRDAERREKERKEEAERTKRGTNEPVPDKGTNDPKPKG